MQRIKMKSASELTIREGMEKYLRWCKLNNYSPDTFNFYRRTIRNFELFCNLDVPLEQLDSELVEEYLLYLKDKDLSSVTVNTYMRGVKTIVNYLADRGLIQKFDIVLPKMEEPIKEVYTEAELKILLKKPDLKHCKFAEYRSWVVVNYLLGTGQRRKTVTNIKIRDLDLTNSLVKLEVMKNRKKVVLPLTRSLTEILDEYLTYRNGKDDDYLFCNCEGNQFSSEGLAATIRKYNQSRGVERTSLHLFRHTFAYLSIKNGMELLRLQQLLCHSRLETTQRYLKSFGFEDLKENYEKYNPLENLVTGNSMAKTWKEQQKRRA